MRVKVAMWLCIVVLELYLPATSLFPPGGNPWEVFVYPYMPVHGRGSSAADAYMNQAMESEVVSRCKETPKAYVYTLEIPGLKKEDVKVEVEEGTLRIKGEEKNYEKQRGEINWSYSQFWKQFPLADDADEDNIQTDVIDGVLTVTVSKHHRRENP